MSISSIVAPLDKLESIQASLGQLGKIVAVLGGGCGKGGMVGKDPEGAGHWFMEKLGAKW